MLPSATDSNLGNSERFDELPQVWVVFAFLGIGFGVALRFINLDGLVFWNDEVIQIYYSFGYTFQEVQERVLAWNGSPVSADDLMVFQTLPAEAGAWDVISGVAREEPQNTRLHYLMLHYWVHLSSSIDALLFGPIVGILVLICLWICFHSVERSFVFLIGGLLVCVFAPLMAMDVIFGGIRSTIPRYLMPSYLGLYLLVACGLSFGLRRSSRRMRLAAGSAWIFLAVLKIASGLRINTKDAIPLFHH